MKKTLIKLAAGMFLTALSFIRVDATCSLPILKVTPSSTSSTPLCPGTVLTVTGTYTGGGGVTAYTIKLISGDGLLGIPTQTITGVSTVVSFLVTVVGAGNSSISLQLDVPPYGTNTTAGCNTQEKKSAKTLYYIDISLSSYLLNVSGSYCFNPTGYDLGLQGDDQSIINYYLYRDGTFITSKPGNSDLGPPVDFSNYTTPGTYSIVGVNPATGCTLLQGQSTPQLTILPLPAVPTIVYTWCGSGGLTLFGSTTTTGASYNWSVSGGNTGTGQVYTVASPVTAGKVYNLTVTSNTCISTTTSTPTSRSLPQATFIGGGNFCTSGGTNALPFTITGISGVMPRVITMYGTNAPAITNNITFESSVISNTAGPGSYTYTGTIMDAYCFNTIAGFVYNVYSNPVLSITTISSGGFYTLTGVSTFNNYQWYYPVSIYFGSNSGQPYATTKSIVVPQEDAGSFTWKVTSTDVVCTSIATILVPCPGCRIAFEDPAPDISTLLYPNPSSGEVNINAPFDNYSLSIYNILGSEVFTKQVEANSTKIDISSVSPGTYTIRMVGKNGQINKKLEIIK